MPRAWIGPVLIGVFAAVGLAGDEPSTASLCAASTGRSQILFVSSSELRRRLNIYVMEPDGSHPRNLTETEADEIDPVYSPDGRSIAFGAVNDRLEWKADLYLMQSDGSQRRRLTHFPLGTLVGAPTWAPDGQRIVFTTAIGIFDHPDHREFHPPVLYRVDKDGDHLKRLGEGILPSWSPDGTQILYTEVSPSGPARKPESHLALMDPDGSRARRLTDREASAGGWSPDGRLIACVAVGGRYPNSRYTYSDLFVMDAEGTHARQLTNDWYSESPPRWSPDGRRILFSPFDSYGMPHGVFSIGVDGRDRRRLPGGGRSGCLGAGVAILPFVFPTSWWRTPPTVGKAAPSFEALVEAVDTADLERLRELLTQGGNPNSASGTGKTALMEAAQFGSAAALRLLLDHGADPKVRMKDGRSALWWAVDGHQTENAKALLGRGVPLEAADGEGRTALMLACQLHDRGLMKLLLDRRAKVEARDKMEMTPLMWAARAGDLWAVQTLLAAGAKVNRHEGPFRTTPLMLATIAPANSLAIIRALIHHGADLTAKNSFGQTALAAALFNYRTEAARLLRAASAKEPKRNRHQSGAVAREGRRRRAPR